MENASGLKLRDYWESCRKGGELPHRADLDPVEMEHFLPDLMIVQTEDICGYHVRLTGTRVARRLDHDPTSQTLDAEAGSVLGGIATLVETCRLGLEPVTGCVAYPDGVESFDAVDCVVLPLRDKTGEVSQFILALDFVFAATSLAQPVQARARHV